ncbi:uncharacterized protein KD926_000782 [Aspergillus affinis]|uniref:uncharacterized protein n=1 Tax=Aspergillus affinis TaxID=1070780 RepID=UPI0022FE26EC|nr:uncharacterized protein KD926_000782 [Aspergillus affinis]KAI9037134.1 hypothetical protein KD926_000782 [Aspergillus affinis]
MTYQRAKQEDPRVIIPWFQTVQAAIQEHGIHEIDIWNFDETGFAMGLCSTSKAAWFQEPKLASDWWIATSQNGWTPDEISLLWLKNVFEPSSKRYMTGAKRLLILNGHSSHLTAEFDDFCKQNAIICFCMPAYTSQLLQPLDVGVFSPLKRAYGKLLEERIAAGNNHIDKEDFLSLYPDARDKVFTSTNIYSGFTGTGLRPFNPERVLSELTFQLRTPTLPLVEGSISSAFQTLQNSLNAKRQLSSSPIAHIQHLEKAAQKSMQTTLLLQQETKVL